MYYEMLYHTCARAPTSPYHTNAQTCNVCNCAHMYARHVWMTCMSNIYAWHVWNREKPGGLHRLDSFGNPWGTGQAVACGPNSRITIHNDNTFWKATPKYTKDENCSINYRQLSLCCQRTSNMPKHMLSQKHIFLLVHFSICVQSNPNDLNNYVITIGW